MWQGQGVKPSINVFPYMWHLRISNPPTLMMLRLRSRM